MGPGTYHNLFKYTIKKKKYIGLHSAKKWYLLCDLIIVTLYYYTIDVIIAKKIHKKILERLKKSNEMLRNIINIWWK